MMNIGVFYGSTTGNTQAVAEKIAAKLEVDIFDISSVKAENLLNYDVLILGSSTWGSGELQDDWETFLPEISKTSLKDKKIALFGTGDQESFSDTFVDAIGLIYEELKKQECQFIGKCSSDGYSGGGISLIDNMFIGLPIDENNQPELTEERVKNWTNQIQKELA